MIDKILQLDREFFLFLNGLGSTTYDGLWLFITDPLHWLPIFILLTFLVFKYLGWRHALLVLAVITLLLVLTHETTNFLKNSVQRLRPGNNPDLAHLMRVVKTSNSFSFISGHAATSMAAAVFLYLVLKPYLRYIGFIFLWPFIFAYSRIYLGLHYPIDVLCGYIWGIGMAAIVWQVYKWARNKYFPNAKKRLDNPTDA